VSSVLVSPAEKTIFPNLNLQFNLFVTLYAILTSYFANALFVETVSIFKYFALFFSKAGFINGVHLLTQYLPGVLSFEEFLMNAKCGVNPSS